MKYAITTLGCKVNQYETAALEKLLAGRGFSPTADGDADVVIINTCAVTAESGRKSRQAIRRMKNDNPGAAVAVCGCFSQIEPDEIRSLGADIVFGSGDKHGLVSALEELLRERHSSVVSIDDPFKRRYFEPLPSGAVEHRTRAMLKIQDGCDNFCTYCIIPYARGRVRSLPPEEAVKEASRLNAEGFRELVLTGIEIASYGKDLRDGSSLVSVTESVIEAAPDARIRLGSLEPTIITEEFCERLSKTGKLCRHFHLSLQSGSDGVLSRMNRKYDTASFYERVELLRKWFPGCGLTADLITGFPGETDSEHAETLEFIKKCGFSQMHIFPYSIRPGTKAAEMTPQIPKTEKTRRAREAQLISDGMREEFLRSCVGQTLSVLFETDGAERSVGHADNYCEVSVPPARLHGLVRNVKIIDVSGQMLVGLVV